MTKGLREHMLNFHQASHAPRTMKNDVLTSSNLLPRSSKVYKVPRPQRRTNSRHPKSPACHTKSSSCFRAHWTTISQNTIFIPFKFIKYRTCHAQWLSKTHALQTVRSASHAHSLRRWNQRSTQIFPKLLQATNWSQKRW